MNTIESSQPQNRQENSSEYANFSPPCYNSPSANSEASAHKDESEYFGNTIATKLRNYDTLKRCAAQNAITGVFFGCRKRSLHRFSIGCCIDEKPLSFPLGTVEYDLLMVTSNFAEALLKFYFQDILLPHMNRRNSRFSNHKYGHKNFAKIFHDQLYFITLQIHFDEWMVSVLRIFRRLPANQRRSVLKLPNPDWPMKWEKMISQRHPANKQKKTVGMPVGPEKFADSFRDKIKLRTRVLITQQPLVHTVFDTSWRRLVQLSPSTVTADNQYEPAAHGLVISYTQIRSMNSELRRVQYRSNTTSLRNKLTIVDEAQERDGEAVMCPCNCVILTLVCHYWFKESITSCDKYSQPLQYVSGEQYILEFSLLQKNNANLLEKTVLGACYLDVRINWLNSRLHEGADNFASRMEHACTHIAGSVVLDAGLICRHLKNSRVQRHVVYTLHYYEQLCRYVHIGCLLSQWKGDDWTPILQEVSNTVSSYLILADPGERCSASFTFYFAFSMRPLYYVWVIEGNMEQRQNERAEETRALRENPLTNGIVRHDSHMQNSGVTRPGIELASPWGGVLAWSRTRKPHLPRHVPMTQDLDRDVARRGAIIAFVSPTLRPSSDTSLGASHDRADMYSKVAQVHAQRTVSLTLGETIVQWSGKIWAVLNIEAHIKLLLQVLQTRNYMIRAVLTSTQHLFRSHSQLAVGSMFGYSHSNQLGPRPVETFCESFTHSSMTCRLYSTVVCTDMPMPTVHWLSGVTVGGDSWASVLQEASNVLWTNV
ncbi:hypothetical protein PR048_029595 [Dryococelus australis]|uniref:Uncharacterized protein n=1 Tax=Dryococelus australis TaxID=614101 RepID=A0ABQ9GEG9_9NEOP|nr:hypothetical protein PR048_029595 [Dryococelus australis]